LLKVAHHLGGLLRCSRPCEPVIRSNHVTFFSRMRPTLRALSSNASASSRAWLARQKRDPYVRLRQSDLYRSRSAFKLLQIEQSCGRFLSRGDVEGVVDLGAAPGGWSQVVAQKLGWTAVDEEDGELARGPGAGRGTILALDLLPMSFIPGVRTLQMDFLHPSTAEHLASLLPLGKADVILSDMAPNLSGNAVSDREKGREICEAVWEFARRVLSKAGPGKSQKKRGVLV
jgi:23S rRNA (uridine2552-2'-O)-methyltransferase